MIWAIALVIALAWPVLYLLARAVFGYREPRRAPESWAEKRARLAFLNQCQAQGDKAFRVWQNPILK